MFLGTKIMKPDIFEIENSGRTVAKIKGLRFQTGVKWEMLKLVADVGIEAFIDFRWQGNWSLFWSVRLWNMKYGIMKYGNIKYIRYGNIWYWHICRIYESWKIWYFGFWSLSDKWEVEMPNMELTNPRISNYKKPTSFFYIKMPLKKTEACRLLPFWNYTENSLNDKNWLCDIKVCR